MRQAAGHHGLTGRFPARLTGLADRECISAVRTTSLNSLDGAVATVLVSRRVLLKQFFEVRFELLQRSPLLWQIVIPVVYFIEIRFAPTGHVVEHDLGDLTRDP